MQHNHNNDPLPQHIAIIMDGNGRWAKSNKLAKFAGHKKGAETAHQIILAANEMGIKYLTLYTFSSENWNRPQDEITNLMSLLKYYIKRKKELLNKNNIKVRVIGDLDKVSPDLKEEIDEIVSITQANKGLTLIIAFSYGARDELLRATRAVAELYKKGDLSLSDINSEEFSSHLYTKSIPDPDLLIRTSGEIRISNFLLWQLAYTELYFTNTNWPDFTVDKLKEAIKEFQNRERRYGK
jgi:undecaprenyl diphosphate synthase